MKNDDKDAPRLKNALSEHNAVGYSPDIFNDTTAVVIEATHFCMHWRGVKEAESLMTNSVMRGAFLRDPALRREFLSLRRVTGR